jgi:hypothetical protein
MGEKGLIQDEARQEASMTTQEETPPEGPALTDMLTQDAEVQTVAGDLKPGDARPPEAQRGLTKGEEHAASIAMTGIEPDIPPEPPDTEAKDEGPDVQDVTGDLNPDDPLTHGHMPI